MSVLVVTSLGEIVVDLHTEKCPLTCKNFLKLCKIKYYNGCLFHTVQKDFTAQTGDPTGTGSGGDSVYKFCFGDQARFFSDEINLDLKHSKTGTVAMVSAGENLNASQFYFTLRDDLDYLDGKHTIFGEIAEGLETLTRINETYVDENNRPYKNIRIKHTYILDDPFDDPPELTEFIPVASPEGKPKDEVEDNVRLEDDWVPLDEQLGPLELEERFRATQAHSSAVVLESIGDIPDVDIKPPDNVLFVCKLNPVTENEDLHTIFSRFGTVHAADIIRDAKTGESLNYAFIEFETAEACEQAYFKMDNALIDDRRIHVDFSQSVSKLWSQYRRKDNQMGKGKGCFKCGALDHIAKDCTGDSANGQQPQKYILKDDNPQRGGGNRSSYDMVFDGDTPESPQQQKRRPAHNPNDRKVDKQTMNRRTSEEPRLRVQQSKGSTDRERPSSRSRSYREDSSRDSHRKSDRSDGSKRGRDYVEERRDRDSRKDRERYADEKTDQRDTRNRYAESGDYRKRSTESDGERHRQRNIDDKTFQRESGKRYVDGDGPDKGDEPGHKRRREDREHRR